MKRLRLFIAVELPESWKDTISLSIRPLVGRFPGIRWVPPANMHLTLKFVGDTDPGRVGEIGAVIDRAARRHLPISVRPGGFGVFPSRGTPRVLWIGVKEDGDALTDLAETLNGDLERLGFAAEKRKFRAHLTLGRVKRKTPGSELRNAVEAENRVGSERLDSLGVLNIDMIVLMQSTLTPRGAIYRVLSRHGR